MVVPIVCSRVMVETLVAQTISSERILISVSASSSIVLPSKKVISAPESSPVFIISPTSKDIPASAFVQLPVPVITNTSPSVMESMVSVVGHGDPPPSHPIRVEATRTDRRTIVNSFLRIPCLPQMLRVFYPQHSLSRVSIIFTRSATRLIAFSTNYDLLVTNMINPIAEIVNCQQYTNRRLIVYNKCYSVLVGIGNGERQS